MNSFANVVVKKPWGYEYLVYQNNSLAIWFLYIKNGEKTSLHCHPNKHTGLVVLDGEVEISFLRGKIKLLGLDKIHIFKRRFHSTSAIGNNGAYLLEVETPEDKDDLIRLNDAYGRKGESYEGAEHYLERNDKHIKLSGPVKLKFEPVEALIKDCKITHFFIDKIKDIELKSKEEDIFIITNGGIKTNKGDLIITVGDIIDGSSLLLLANEFEIVNNSSVIYITKIL
jgi:mannose-6-phosphate isomerase-like protein (cupin superfamily)